MVRGLYAAASGMVAGMLQQDVIAQNLANVDTPGYKKDVALVGAFADEMAVRVEDHGAWRLARTAPLGRLGSGAYVRGTGFDRSEGPIIETGAPLDLAIQGDGYFVVETPEGEAYTRNGSFTLNARGELVTMDGMPVLGESGRVVIPSGGEVEVRGDGRVAVDGQIVDRLRLVTFDGRSLLRKTGGGLFVAPPGAARSLGAADGVLVRQGFLEMSNVSAVTEMVQMIAGMRAYETCQRVIWFLDQTLDKSINDVGRVA
ncbi:MAG: flagellar basal-body rod protein FlgF [Firmicutes bacterium]|nr:flagellar basal-body rod protein FlgF [Bacillota bacterium]